MENYLKKEKEGGRFSFETILNEELRLDRDEEPSAELSRAPQSTPKGKGGNPQ
jgi:hypothetical protein